MLKLKLSRLILVRIVFALVIILMMVLSYQLLVRINKQTASAELVSKTNLIHFYVERVVTKLQFAEEGQRGFLLTKDSGFMQTYRQNQQEITIDLANLDSIAKGHFYQKNVDSLHTLASRRILVMDSVLKNSNNHESFDIKTSLLPGKMLMDSINNYAKQLGQNELKLLGNEEKLNQENTFDTPRFSLLLIIFALIVFTLYFISLNKQLRISNAYHQQRQKALEDLEDMNLIYQNAEKVAGLGSWQWNLDTNTFKGSDNLFRIFGSEPRDEEISFNRFMSFILPEDREMLAHYIEEALRSKEAVVANYRILRADGVIRQMRVIGKQMDNTSEPVMLGATQDVTEVNEAMERLKASESFNRSITQLVPNVIYIFDLDNGTLLYLNTFPIDVLGFTYQELSAQGFNFLQNIHPDDLPLFMERRAHFPHLKDKEVAILQYRIKNKNGEWISIYDRTTCFKRNESGLGSQVIGVASDVTEIRKANEKLFSLNKELEEKNKELQQTNAELSSFNFIASHDLQEPLRKIQTFVSYLEESEHSLSDTGKFYLKRLQLAAARIRSLIQDILTYSHFTHFEKELEAVELDKVLENALKALDHIIVEKKIQVRADSLPIVQGNEQQLQQLFENLLSNAFKYSKSGIAPVVSITSGVVKNEDDILPGLDADRSYHKISFKDNGIGFEQEYASKIFDLFQRLHSKSEYEGTGIGLAICKKIVLHHGGAIEASSVPGNGSVFDIYLPMSTSHT